MTCAETLSILRPDSSITLISASTLIKSVSNFKQVSKLLEEFTVEEKSATEIERNFKNLKVIHATAIRLNAEEKSVDCSNGNSYPYDKLCICTGGTPRLLADQHPHVIGIRDVESVKAFQQKLSAAKRIAVVGNGGIALELVYEIENCQVVWAIRHGSIGNTFFDVGAAQFLIPKLFERLHEEKKTEKRQRFESEMVNGVPVFTMKPRGGCVDDVVYEADKSSGGHQVGSALGPDWKESLDMKGALEDGTETDSNQTVMMEYRVEVEKLMTQAEMKAAGLKEKVFVDGELEPVWPVYVQLSNGNVWGVDLVVSATGVNPCNLPLGGDKQLKVSEDGGVVVDDKMRSSVADVFAAGDACTAGWTHSEQWFQMRLWSQARQMGGAAAKSMVADLENRLDRLPQDFCFECFAHVTKFFNYKCVLIGRYNGQGLEDYELILRTTPGVEYIKLVVLDGRIQGAVFIGETDLEETFENLILNQMDISRYGEDILHPGVDIEDYFD